MNERTFSRSVAEENLCCLDQGFYETAGERHLFSLSPADRKQAVLVTPYLCREYVQHFLNRLSPQTAPVTVAPEDSLAHPSALVMNFASPVHPGGGYLEGSGARRNVYAGKVRFMSLSCLPPPGLSMRSTAAAGSG